MTGIQLIAQILSLIGIIFKVDYIYLMSIFIFYTFFAVGIGGIMYTFLAEILPVELLSIGTVFLFGTAIIISQFTLPIYNAYGAIPLFIFTNCYTVFVLVIFNGFCIETKGKNPNQIKKEFVEKGFFK